MRSGSNKTGNAEAGASLPMIGLSKWSQIAPFLPVGRETWRKLCLAGKAPPPIRLSEKCTVYKNEEIHRYLENPLGYIVKPEVNEVA
ncbi:AlpA family transcriptional regulator [Paraburkholderia sp. BL18I3N2]|uniref:helix-turn-helix transcriptional regulator n=1 Tax=Paraburkholderia sp. BL18I3N2 TaxID=1938799 RepID=UPI000D05CF76|nr:transcriptional regulator [Paraburkholderia sp. BL18I3N2]PRX32235.1 AlpA family transcriptional regulator [Paraburkholderia sp. BL18I3N2]